MRYTTKGTCSRFIDFDVEDNKVTNAALVEGMDINEVIKRLKGIDCNGRGTSCPDQLAIALEQYLEQK